MVDDIYTYLPIRILSAVDGSEILNNGMYKTHRKYWDKLPIHN